MKTPTRTILFVIIILCSVVSSFGWLRGHFSDEVVVSRAELIVVGRIKADSIVFIPHKIKDGGKSWEYHADLLIDEILKGQMSASSIAVCIHYGLDPLIGGHAEHQDISFDYRFGRKNYPKDVIEIFDTGNSSESFAPISGDIRKKHIWLLHHALSTSYTDSVLIGIEDPEDIQPLSRKTELSRYVK